MTREPRVSEGAGRAKGRPFCFLRAFRDPSRPDPDDPPLETVEPIMPRTSARAHIGRRPEV